MIRLPRHRFSVIGVAALAVLAGPTRRALADRLATGAPADTFAFSDWATGLTGPTDLRFLPDGRAVIIQRNGQVKVRATDGTIAMAGTVPVDNTHGEKGLLGIEVHPDFATTKTLFLYYSASSSAPDPGTSTDRHRVVSITLDNNQLAAGSERILVRGLRGPANHDGGALAIGNDGKLYIGVGDTGCNSGMAPEPTYTPRNFFPTCVSNGNGKVLRVNLDGTIPSDNPLVGMGAATQCGSTCGTNIATTGTGAAREDIWAWGFRNPWRFWIDPRTGSLWVGDVGEVTYEEITIAQKGKHHGWPWREGAHGWPTSKCREMSPDPGDCVEPVYDCNRGAGCQSITGGVITDHCSWPPAFRGTYLFGDNARGTLWTMDVSPTRDGLVAGSRKDFGQIEGATPVSIRIGPDAAVYVVAYSSANPGRIARLAPQTPSVCPPDVGPEPSATDGPAGNDDAGGGDAPGVTGGGGGCGCDLAGGQVTAWAAGAALLLLAMQLLRRRARVRLSRDRGDRGIGRTREDAGR